MIFAENEMWFTHTATGILSVAFGAFGAGLPLYFYFRSRMTAARSADTTADADARKAAAQAFDSENEVRDREFQRLMNRYENQITKQEQRHREQFEEVKKELCELREENIECQRRSDAQAEEIAELRRKIHELTAKLERQ